MNVLLDARISPGKMGGVEQVVTAIAQGLDDIGRLQDVTFLTTADDEWIRSRSGGLSVAHARRATRSLPAAADALRRRAVDRVPQLGRLGRLGSPVPRGAAVATVGRPHVIHFLTQQGFTTSVPTIYSPYDLLHLHHPEFFSAAEVARRERVYRCLCHQARLVMAMTSSVRDDLVGHYGMERERVRIVPLGASAPTAETAPVEVRDRYRLPERFALYPAHTWPHKNHLRLLEALALLRDEHNLIVPLVCTGQEESHADSIRDTRDRLGLGDQVHLLGRVPASCLAALFGLARCLVFPSLFEGWGLPVFEAFAWGVPVACSTATSLPEQTRGAAVLFDPQDVVEMAAAIGDVWEDEAVRSRLVAAGHDRVRTLTWTRTAMAYVALYREVAGFPLEELDRRLVAATLDGSVEHVPLPISGAPPATGTA